VLGSEQCRIQLGSDAGTRAPLPRTVTISVEPDAKSVRTGQRLRLRIVITNTGASSARLVVVLHTNVFGLAGDPTGTTPGFHVDAFDSKNRTVDFPRDIGLLGMLNARPESGVEVELPPGTRAEAAAVWDATGYDPDKNYSQQMRGMDVLPPPEPLRPGKYRLRITTPIFGGADPSIEITVKR
jgi:hypothetical protein